MFDRYLSLWELVPDGDPQVTATSRLLPVRAGSVSAMLKVSIEAEEQRGNQLMVWWGGDGAARVLRCDGPAILLERADGPRSLARMARAEHDDDASRIACGVAERLHAPRGDAPPPLVPLTAWFEPLVARSRSRGRLVELGAGVARDLLAAPRDVGVLHGDLHHDNVLDAGARGFVAIDPKALYGERAFDFANLFRNPDVTTATAPVRFARRAAVIAEAAELDPERLLRWVLAVAALSATWLEDEGRSATNDLAVARCAAAELGLVAGDA